MPCVNSPLYVRPKPDGYTNTTVDASTSAYPVPRIGSSPAPIADRPQSGTNLHDWNTYTDDGVKKCVLNCGSHKVVQAIKNWHGRYGFDYCPTGDCPALPQKKYRTVRVKATMTEAYPDVVPPDFPPYEEITWSVGRSASWDCKVTTDRYSGLQSLIFSIFEQSHIEGYSDLPEYENFSEFDGLYMEDFFKISCVTAHLEDWNTESGTQGDGTYESKELTIYDDTHFKVVGLLEVFDPTPISFNFRRISTFEVWLEDEYSLQSLIADAASLAYNWQLNSDKLPWRGDGWRGLGVIVKYWERDANYPDQQHAPGWYDPAGYDTGVDTGIPINTGAVLGAPFSGWPNKTFSWEHPKFIGTLNPDLSCTWSVYSYGASSGVGGSGDVGDLTDTVIPPNASFWTDNNTAALLRPGSWLMMKDDSALFLQKQVERKIGFHSHNNFRPCGSDRYMIDTAVAACVSSIAGSVVTMEGSLAVTSDDLVVFYGSDNHGKVFHVVSSSGTTLTLGAEVSANGVADAFTDYSGYANQAIFGAGIVGKVRFPDAWPICGKIQVASAIQYGGNVAITLQKAAHYLVTGDKVDFVETDADDTATGLANLTVTVTDSLHFTVPGTLDAGHSKCVKSHGAPLAKWNTDAPRGDFVWQEWEQTFPSGVETWTVVNTQSNSITPTPYSYLTSTPNDESPNRDVIGFNKDFPTTLSPTSCGTMKIVFPVQFVADPLWQVPFYCATDEGKTPVWCAPRVEARLAVPSGAPALPGGLTTGIPTSPPAAVGLPACDEVAPAQHEAPWIPCAV